ncbi:MAG: hypothetical protein ABSG68_10645 [Thermoguttaceae bacterium]|jgi:hypothetical protein
MKRVYLLVVTAAAIVGGGWLVRDLAQAQAPEKAAPAETEKGITLTKSQWQELLAKKVAEALAKEIGTPPVSDKQVLERGNWHTAVYNGTEFTVYTGPGQALVIADVAAKRAAAARAAQPPAQPATGPAKPFEGPSKPSPRAKDFGR